MTGELSCRSESQATDNCLYGLPRRFQVDLRAGWRKRISSAQSLELFLDVFNLTNRGNFDNPSGDERVPATFLVVNQLRGGGGFPRQAKLGVRFTF